MKQYTVNYVKGLELLGSDELEAAFSKNSSVAKVDNINWPDSFPYGPLCEFQVLRSDSYLGVRFNVESLDLRATALEDNGRSWEDSCCEFFVLGDDGKYTNIETTCIGSVLMARGEGRSERETLPKEAVARVIRYSSLEKSEYALAGGPYRWDLMILVPFDLIRIGGKMPVMANFYKCGDLTAHPHFLSWSPIQTETPNFHCPEFFGELYF